jgi:hypothetical protein
VCPSDLPYRLDDVTGVFRYRDDNLVVERLTGRGADGALLIGDGGAGGGWG